jgi:hypothetical protein
MSCNDIVNGNPKHANIQNCQFYGIVKGTYRVGGICGYLEGKAISLTNRGLVMGEEYIGGITGEIFSGNYEDFKNEGYVYGHENVGLICNEKHSKNIRNKTECGRILSEDDPILKLYEIKIY